MATLNQCLSMLSRHIGQGNGIGAKTLAQQLDTPERNVRMMISELRNEGYAICGTPSSGYYIAATPDELEQTCAFLRHRAMHSLRMESRLRKISLPDLLGQLHVPT